MSNDYFTATDLTPNTQAKAEDINTRMDSLESAFDKLPAPHASAPTTKGFSEVFTVTKGTARSHALNIEQVQDQELVYALDTGTANAYAVALTPALTAYATGQIVVMKALNSNTGACTLDVNGLGVKSIKTTALADPAADAITANGISVFIYDGTYFQLLFAYSISTSDLGQYTKKDGSVTFTGNQSFGGFNITSVGTIGSGAITSTGAIQGLSLTDGTMTITGGNISAAGTIGCGAITSTGAFSCGANAVTCGAITTSGTLNMTTHAISNATSIGGQYIDLSGATGSSIVTSGGAVPLVLSQTGSTDTSYVFQITTDASATSALRFNVYGSGKTEINHRGETVADEILECYSDAAGGGLVKAFHVLATGAIYSLSLTGGAVNLTVDAAGNIIRDPSDERYKKDVKSIPKSLDIINRLNPVSYNWNPETINMGDHREYGFIAQEVEKFLPEAVTVDNSPEKYKGVRYNSILTILVKAVQEIWKIVEPDHLQTRRNKTSISAMTLKIQSLEQTNEKLLKRIEALEERGV